MGSQDYFFYQQTGFREIPKRYRKLPEELPESLKYAHLNPKVAALLANKEKQKQEEMMEALGRKSAMADLNNTFQQIKNHFDFDQFSNEEDSQRYLYEEAKYTSGNILELLARFIYRYDNICNIIPKSLERQISSTYQDLIADVVYVTREWQTQAMREPSAKNSEINTEEDHATVIDEDIRQGRPGSEKIRKKAVPKMSLPEISEDDRKIEKPKPSAILHKSNPDSKSSIARSKSRLERGKSTMNLDKLTVGSTVKSPGLRSRIHCDGDKLSHGGSPNEGRATGIGNPNYMSVIHFELSSKTCEDKGWIKKKGNEEDIDSEELFEWCLNLLQQSLKAIKEQEKYERSQGLDKPVVVRYYGDTRMETLLRYRKSPIKTEVNPALRGHKPRIPSVDNERNEGKTLMLSGHMDGTTVVYYPSGRPAIIHSAAGYGRLGYYTIAYDDQPAMNMLASFTPSGKGCIYHSNGVIRFLATSTGGHVADKDGRITKKWKWPPSNVKIMTPVSLQINSSIGFRCIALSQMALYYNNEKESAKFLVSPMLDPETNYGDESDQHLVTTFSFTSNAAKELMRLFNNKKQKKKKKDKSKGSLSEVHKLCDYPEQTLYGTQDEKELARLQRKAKNLVDDWLEHYRISIGLSSPSLYGMEDMPTSRQRYSQSAKMSNKDFVSRGETIGLNEQMTIKSGRTPSAPSGLSKRPSYSASTASRQNIPAAVKFEENLADSQEAGGDMAPSALAVMNRLMSVSSPARSQSSRSRSSRPKTSPRQPTLPSLLDTSFSYASCENCPVVLRQRIMGQTNVYCRCSRHNIPLITDYEFDDFLRKVAPNAQLQVVVIISSLFPKSNLALEMLEKMYSAKNRNRMRPCPQSRVDTERFLKYDINTAADNSNHTQPLLLTRHNAVPGMILIYSDSNLLFCDHIFNGYGYTKKDFKKQINKSLLDAIHGVFLPKDFRFSPSRGHHGARSAWGGDIGGAGVDSHGSPGTTRELVSQESKSSGMSIDDQQITKLRPYELNYLMELSSKSSEFLPSIKKRNGCSSLHLYESITLRVPPTHGATQSQPTYSCQVTSASIS